MRTWMAKGIIGGAALLSLPLWSARVEALTWAEALGIGAGALIIHEVSKGGNRQPPSPQQEYNRGLQDGRNHVKYDNPRNSYDYDRGYEEGLASFGPSNRFASPNRFTPPPRNNTFTRSTPENLISTVPGRLADLVGARAGQAEGDLISRGYTFRNTVNFDGGKATYYTENNTGWCVEVGTVDGRFSSIVYNSSDRCLVNN